MKRLLPLFLATFAVLLAACNYVDPSLTQRSKVYTDKGVDQSDLVITVRPKERQLTPLKTLMYPFWIQQDTPGNTVPLGLEFARIVQGVWIQKELFPTLALDENLRYTTRDKALETARRLGADILVLGFVPYLYAGSTIDDTAITVQVNLYETRTGQLVLSMAQSARIDYRPPKDWVILDHVTRMPDAPLWVAVRAIAEDMAVPLASWLPPMDSNLGYAYSAQAIEDGLTGRKDGTVAEENLPADARSADAKIAGDLAARHSVNIRVEFDVDKSTIRPEYQPYLDELGKALTSPELAGKSVVLAGHTDNSGDTAYNQRLSEQRAAAVKAYLVQKFGLDAARILTRGYGESRPVAPNDTPQNKQRNRRVEVWLNENA